MDKRYKQINIKINFLWLTRLVQEYLRIAKVRTCKFLLKSYQSDFFYNLHRFLIHFVLSHLYRICFANITKTFCWWQVLSGSDITTIQCSCSHLCIPLLLQFFLDDFEFKKPNQALLNMEKSKLMPCIATIKIVAEHTVYH